MARLLLVNWRSARRYNSCPSDAVNSLAKAAPMTAAQSPAEQATARSDRSRFPGQAMRPAWAAAAAVVGLLVVTLGLRTSDPPALQMQTFATAWLDSLDEQQRGKASLAFDAPQRTDWNFVPLPTRKGLPLMDMNTAQQAGALRTVRAALSEAGYTKATQIMLMESVLRHFEGAASHERRNPEKYYLTVYGTPSASETWGLSFEGHHLSLNFVCRDGQVIASTPQFVAANPAEIKSDVPGPLGKGTQILREEEELAFALITRLPAAQREQAIIAPKAPADIRFINQVHVTPSEPQGLPASQMNEAAQKQLLQLIEVYANMVPEPLAKQRMETIKNDGLDSLHFAWAGATERHVGHYYRIQGQSFVIELCNTQPDAEGTPANHIHAVWRDLNGDFGLPIQ